MEQQTGTGELIMSLCWLRACRTCSRPRSILSIRWSPLWRSSSRFNSNCAILSCINRGAALQSVSVVVCCLLLSLFTSMSLTWRALSSFAVAFVSASPSRSWSLFSSAVTLSTASSRCLWHCCSSPSCCDNCNKTHQQSVTREKRQRLVISATVLDIPGLALHNRVFCKEQARNKIC